MTSATPLPMAEFVREVRKRETSRTPLSVEALGGVVDGGPGRVDGPAEIHSVINPAALGEDAVSVHVYCRPYDECDIYDPERGTVQRVRLAYDSVPALS